MAEGEAVNESLGTSDGYTGATTQTAVTKVLIDAFEVAGEPVSKARARVTSHGTFTPQKTRDAEAAVLRAWAKGKQSLLGNLATDTYELRCDFYLGNHRRRDLDNMTKLVLDALNGRAYIDDSQIVELTARKHFVPKAEARTEVRLWVLSTYVLVPSDHIVLGGTA